MAETFLYRMNDTMKLLEHQCIIDFAGFDKLEDIFAARKAKGTNNQYDIAIDAFSLGYIMGKRAERAKRKRA